MSNIKATKHDIVPAGLCMPGAKEWFTQNGLQDQWRGFIKDGIDIDTLSATGCPLAAKVVAQALIRQGVEDGEK